MSFAVTHSSTRLLLTKPVLNTSVVSFINTKRNVISTTNDEHHTVNTGHYNVVVVGGGIIGLATAQELVLRHPNLKIGLIERETQLAEHQTGHNSGVIHAGIYYKPGSLMAKLCVEGLHATYKYCDKFRLPYNKCGKLVVATNQIEVDRLESLYSRALQNKVPDIKLLDGEKAIQEIEPYCKGLKAIHSPHTGIVDWGQVAKAYGENFKAHGGKIHLGFDVQSIDVNKNSSSGSAVKISGKAMNRLTDRSLSAHTNQTIECDYVLTCTGLYSDRVAALTGCSSEPKIIPFRGEYLLLNPEKAKLIKGNIYPVPDPAFPFLGVHFTPRLNGEVWLGPNAVLAFKREGYKWSDINLKDLTEILTYRGFYKLAAKYVKFGSMEMLRSIFISLSVKELQKYVPEVTSADIQRGPSGVRAQAMNVNGDLVGDFVFDTNGPILHCRNAPSPGATSSIPIGRMMVDKMEKDFGLSKTDHAELF